MYGASTTGSNNVPLGTRRKRRSSEDGPEQQVYAPPTQGYRSSYPEQSQAGGASYGGSSYAEPAYGGSASFGGNYGVPVKSEPGQSAPANSDSNDAADEGREGRARKRRSRWGAEESKVNIPGLPTVLPSNLPKDQLEGFVIHMRLEEINRKLRSGEYVPLERSPSPEPIYGADGKRINTREYRYRKKLEDERHKLVEEGIRKVPGFKPPADYKKPTKMSDKLYIPVKDYPEINFIGQLIGPRGTTLKRIESESGAKISIRGKGSVKEGKSRSDGAPAPGEEDELHCLVTADSEEKVKIAMKAIEKVIETAASVPEGQNELKRMQLRYLAELNGTLRDDENQICPNCGGTGHRRFDCPEQKNYTVNLICRNCGGAGHTARERRLKTPSKDCMQRHNPDAVREMAQRDEKLDSEYANLMAELGENGANGPATGDFRNGGGRSGHYGPGRGGASGGRPPWAGAGRGDGGAPPPWQRRDSAPTGAAGGLPPWQQQQQQDLPPGFSAGPPGMGPPGMAPP
ncbi:hypothetical protein HK104_009248, partial [Borealophlyctis nickersoniae]